MPDDYCCENKVTKGADGFLRTPDGIKLCRVANGQLEFLIKDRRKRNSRGGARVVRVPLDTINKAASGDA